MTDKKVNISDVNEEGYPNREVTNPTVDHSCSCRSPEVTLFISQGWDGGEGFQT
jgi:hypothetical protein